MKKLKKLLGACFALVAFASAATSSLAQIEWQAGVYSPSSRAGMESNRWSEYALPHDTKLFVNIWGPWNAAGNRTDSSGWRMPMQQWVRIYDVNARRWRVSYDVVGEMGGSSPYRNPDADYSWVKSYPHIQYKPASLYVWEGNNKVFRSEWDLRAESADWDNNRFNAIYEIRLNRLDQSGKRIPNSDYIIQLEIMQARYGTPPPHTVSLSGYTWATEVFHTFPAAKGENKVPVLKFIRAGAGVTGNSTRAVTLDLFSFMQFTANNPAKYTWDSVNQKEILVPKTYPRASWNAKVQEVNAGVEVCLGTSSTVWTDRFWVSYWNR